MISILIPIRAGSKGVPNKNIYPFLGKPLYMHTLQQALALAPCRILISTDIPSVLETPHHELVRLIRRPRELSGDSVSMAPVVIHAINKAQIKGMIVLLQVTSPLRSSKDISAAIKLFKQGNAKLVMTVVPADSGVLKYGTMSDSKFLPLRDSAFCFANRQDLPKVFKPNGAIYVFDAQWFLDNKGFRTNKIEAVMMPAERSVDIDSKEDLALCQKMLRQRGVY